MKMIDFSQKAYFGITLSRKALSVFLFRSRSALVGPGSNQLSNDSFMRIELAARHGLQNEYS